MSLINEIIAATGLTFKTNVTILYQRWSHSILPYNFELEMVKTKYELMISIGHLFYAFKPLIGEEVLSKREKEVEKEKTGVSLSGFNKCTRISLVSWKNLHCEFERES
ncbi:hypothetical protein AMTRI_Chr04g246930 [Amborella trichopoda]